jgi:hypothetical protein
MARKHIEMAIAYDFDGTLADGNMQEHQFLPDIGMKPAAFWAEVKRLTEEQQADEVLVYMNLMLRKADADDLRRRRKAPVADPRAANAGGAGFTAAVQAEALRLRGGRLRNVVLDDVPRRSCLRINRFTHRGREYPFDLEDAHEAIRRLKPTPDRQKGLRGTNQDIYDTLVLGTTITKTIDGDSQELFVPLHRLGEPGEQRLPRDGRIRVERTASTQTKRCDIVAFVNGIPFW